MNTEKQPHQRAFWVIPPIVLGLVVLGWLVGGKQTPAKAERGEPSRTVRVVEAPSLNLVPTAQGYGPVKPARVWAALPQVAGRVVETHSQLHDGEILTAGTDLVRIDPVDFELALAQAKAELAELQVRKTNAAASLAIEQRNFTLAQRELERRQKLAKQGTLSRSKADDAERSMLGTRAAVQNLRNTLALNPAQRRLLETKVARAERDLQRTVIRAPFNLRVANVKIEADQFVSIGQTLFEGDAVDRVEIHAQMNLSSLRRLFIGRADVAKLEMTEMFGQMSEIAGLKSLVRLDLGDNIAEWEAEFVRFSSGVDPHTRTMGLVVAVDRPFDKVVPGHRPPLTKGMFLQVVLRGRPQPRQIVVPRHAVRGGAVYVADAQNRLRRRAVTVLFNQGVLSVIGEGLEPGEWVVVSDVVPAVEGMLLRPRIDKALAAELAVAAGDDS